MVSGDILFFVEFLKTELIPKKYNYSRDVGGFEMVKEKIAKELMVKWLLENKGTNLEEVLKEITSHTYTEKKLKEAN
ncbi:hypothetical protein BK741_32330 [Bacillus thuringiensis serovar iberica]|uniref:Uncharacterized protein n=2 Tax=Bacillus thuringiensis TaxID=1428 RepID=A0A9X6LAW1_BACTU|nr:hypothetical protein BK741_32330 [Bacillus thuringiensis serovar iberica]